MVWQIHKKFGDIGVGVNDGDVQHFWVKGFSISSLAVIDNGGRI